MILYSARAAVAENCRRCGSDNTESAVHPIITVQFAPLVHRACFVSSRQQRQRPCLATAPAAHTARVDDSVAPQNQAVGPPDKVGSHGAAARARCLTNATRSHRPLGRVGRINAVSVPWPGKRAAGWFLAQRRQRIFHTKLSTICAGKRREPALHDLGEHVGSAVMVAAILRARHRTRSGLGAERLRETRARCLFAGCHRHRSRTSSSRRQQRARC